MLSADLLHKNEHEKEMNLYSHQGSVECDRFFAEKGFAENNVAVSFEKLNSSYRFSTKVPDHNIAQYRLRPYCSSVRKTRP